MESSGTYTYEWQFSSDGIKWNSYGFAFASEDDDANKLSVSVTEDNVDYQYRCIVHGTGNNTKTSDPVRVIIKEAVEGGPQNVDIPEEEKENVIDPD